MNLKELIKNKKSGFATDVITVNEWGDKKINIREPSLGAWSRWGDVVGNDDEKDANIKRIKAEVILFIDCILDDKGENIFTEKDEKDLIDAYGPIHSRILNKALSLADIGKNPIEEAEKK